MGTPDATSLLQFLSKGGAFSLASISTVLEMTNAHAATGIRQSG
jgi:hypothetical protein